MPRGALPLGASSLGHSLGCRPRLAGRNIPCLSGKWKQCPIAKPRYRFGPNCGATDIQTFASPNPRDPLVRLMNQMNHGSEFALNLLLEVRGGKNVWLQSGRQRRVSWLPSGNRSFLPHFFPMKREEENNWTSLSLCLIQFYPGGGLHLLPTHASEHPNQQTIH